MERLLTTKEAARFLGVSEAFLERDRCYGARIPFIRVGQRAVRYLAEDLRNYVAKHKKRSTADHAGPTETPAAK